MTIPQRLTLVAMRLEAGLRETPQRFLPVAHWLAMRDASDTRALLLYLVDDALAEGPVDLSLTARVRDLLLRAQDLLANSGDLDAEQHAALLSDIAASAPLRRRRRSIHCHGAITSDRRLLMLQTILARADPNALSPSALGWGIAYAVSDYECDHFEMRGPQVAHRVRRLAEYCKGLVLARREPA